MNREPSTSTLKPAVKRPVRAIYWVVDRETRQARPVDNPHGLEAYLGNERYGLVGTGLARDTIGDLKVSTVFLGVDHSWGDDPPILFETMVFTADSRPRGTWRYSTWDEALTGHGQVVAELREEGAGP